MASYKELDQEYIWHPYSPYGETNRLMVSKAYKTTLELEGGKKLIDAVASWWANIHGHAHPELIQALTSQASMLDHVLFAGFTHKPAIEFTSLFLSVLPENQKRIFFSDNGSTSVEVALKLSLQYHKNKNNPRSKFIAIDGAFHGDTFGAMTVSERGLFTEPFKDVLSKVSFIPFPDGSNHSEIIAQFEKLCIKQEYAAFIYEPLIQGASGMRMYDPDILNQLINISKKYDVLAIADEVMTGFGRTGKLFASFYIDNLPDIMCFSKGITGGILPLGATTFTKAIENTFIQQNPIQIFYHGHTFTANPITCNLALVSLKVLLQSETQKSIERISSQNKIFAEQLAGFNVLKRVQHLGTIVSLEFKVQDSGYLSNIRNILYAHFIERGILLRPLGNVLYIIPPYSITVDELNYVHDELIKYIKNYSILN
jgi:adenosylmethionine-8-amino-7-oxononanoate aminotransferase